MVVDGGIVRHHAFDRAGCGLRGGREELMVDDGGIVRHHAFDRAGCGLRGGREESMVVDGGIVRHHAFDRAGCGLRGGREVSMVDDGGVVVAIQTTVPRKKSVAAHSVCRRTLFHESAADSTAWSNRWASWTVVVDVVVCFSFWQWQWHEQTLSCRCSLAVVVPFADDIEIKSIHSAPW
jgi:hypothetical protein